MASIDFKLEGKNANKKGVSVLTANIKPADVTVAQGFDTAGTIAIDDTITVANLPTNSIVTKAFVQVVTGPTTGTQKFGITVGGTAVMAAVALGTADNTAKGTTTVKKVSGPVVITNTVADLVDGEMEVIIEYIEPDLTTGALTAV